MLIGGTMSVIESIPSLDDLAQFERLPAARAVYPTAAEKHDGSRYEVGSRRSGLIDLGLGIEDLRFELLALATAEAAKALAQHVSEVFLCARGSRLIL